MSFVEKLVTLHRSDESKIAETIEVAKSAMKEVHKSCNTTLWQQDAYLQAEIERVQSLARKKGALNLPLLGVPVGIKDNINVKDTKTTCGSKMLEGYTSPYEATVSLKLAEAGAIRFCKLNMDEFAMGSSNENSAYGAVKNPMDLLRVPGGSSGGSAAVVAGGGLPLSIGSDTGGSIRQPAAFTGIYGFKPSYGRVSRYGLVAFASSLDQVGPFARSNKDLHRLYDVLQGVDPLDDTTRKIEFSEEKKTDSKKIAVLAEKLLQDCAPEVLSAYQNCLDQFKSKGYELISVDPKGLKECLSIYYILAPAEAAANLARFDGVRYGAREPSAKTLEEVFCKTRSKYFGSEVKRRIITGTYVLSAGYQDAYYRGASRGREVLRAEFKKIFSQADFLFLPTAPTAAFKLGEKTGDPLAMYLNDLFTIPANLAELPALSFPVENPQSELPVGMQLVGPYGCDSELLQFQSKIDDLSKTEELANTLAGSVWQEYLS
jgi:aspartyl-tRNA(Asn)/glutamyl-tRNA(Gln) amidotransferase subunit A